MTVSYELITSEISGNQILSRINENGSITFIPMNEENPEYQAYLAKDEVKADEAKTK